MSFLGKVSVVDRILVSLSHVRRAQSSPLNEVPNFLESRSAPVSVLIYLCNSDIDASGACSEYSSGNLLILSSCGPRGANLRVSFLLLEQNVYRIVQIHRRVALEGMKDVLGRRSRDRAKALP